MKLHLSTHDKRKSLTFSFGWIGGRGGGGGEKEGVLFRLTPSIFSVIARKPEQDSPAT